MVKVADLAITSLDVIKVYELSGTPWFVMDELQDTTIANTQEKEEITGKGGRKLASLKKNKGVTVSGTSGLISAGMLEAQTGGTFSHETAAPVAWTDYLVINADAATTEFKAVGTAGAEIEGLYLRNPDGSAGAKLEQDAAVADGKFTYDPATKALAFNAGAYADGTEIVVFYTRNIEADVLANHSDTYSKVVRMYIDGTAEDKCGNVFHIQFYIPKADLNGEFDIQMGDSQATHEFEAESLAGSGCGSAGTNGVLWTYTVFGVNAADA